MAGQRRIAFLRPLTTLVLLCHTSSARAAFPIRQWTVGWLGRTNPWSFAAIASVSSVNETTRDAARDSASDILDCPVTRPPPSQASGTLVVDPAARRIRTLQTWKERLPGRLRTKSSRIFQKICLGSTDIYLLGTAHVSNDSSTEVRLLLEHVRPNCVFVELCDSRIPLLEGNPEEEHNTTSVAASETINQTSVPQKMSLWKRIQSTQQAQGSGTSRWQALSTVLLSNVQEDYAKELGVELGGEFRCAHQYWRQAVSDETSTGSERQTHLVLGDRPLHLTLIRAWESLTFWPKVKVIVGLLWSSFRPPDKEEIRRWLQAVMQDGSDVLTQSFEELRQHFPTLYTTIISERDAWLAAKLVQTCRALQASERALPPCTGSPDPLPPRRTSIVAIVGAGHVPGICEWLTTTKYHTNGRPTTPETVLAELVTTRRWAHEQEIQTNAIPMWVHEVSELREGVSATAESSH